LRGNISSSSRARLSADPQMKIGVPGSTRNKTGLIAYVGEAVAARLRIFALHVRGGRNDSHLFAVTESALLDSRILEAGCILYSSLNEEFSPADRARDLQNKLENSPSAPSFCGLRANHCLPRSDAPASQSQPPPAHDPVPEDSVSSSHAPVKEPISLSFAPRTTHPPHSCLAETGAPSPIMCQSCRCHPS